MSYEGQFVSSSEQTASPATGCRIWTVYSENFAKKKPNYVVWRKCGKPKNVWWGNVKKNKYYIM